MDAAGKIVKKLKRLAKKMVLYLYRLSVKLLPINKKIILFESNLGRNYTGNPKAIYEEMIRQGLDRKYRCYFIMEHPETKIPGAARTVKRTRLKYFYLFAVSGTWVCDTRLPIIYHKKTGMYLYPDLAWNAIKEAGSGHGHCSYGGGEGH
jgi:CDP-glycerol glycerophosphotransferase